MDRRRTVMVLPPGQTPNRDIAVPGHLWHSIKRASSMAGSARTHVQSLNFLAEKSSADVATTSRVHFQGYAARLSFLLPSSPNRLTNSVASWRVRFRAWLASCERPLINRALVSDPGHARNSSNWVRFLGFLVLPSRFVVVVQGSGMLWAFLCRWHKPFRILR
jgi:hypothetical protein